MKIITEIPVKKIKLDRQPISRVFNLAKHMENGGDIPPIHVCKLPDGNYGICDGRHRVTAARLIGQKMITAKFSNKVNKQWRR